MPRRSRSCPPYPEVYDDCTDVALQEQRDGVMPAYQGDVGGWDGVSVVYLGYPIWWMDLPQVIKSFIADHDWAGPSARALRSGRPTPR